MFFDERQFSGVSINMKFKFNPKLVPICIYYFLINSSFNMLYPYFTIQMRSLGLSLDDAALISELQVTRPGGHLVTGGQVVIGPESQRTTYKMGQ